MQTRPDNLALLTDLYEFTMAEVYFQSHMFAPATFSLFIRAYPPQRGYFVSAGLEEVLEFLTQIEYSRQDLYYLKSTGRRFYSFGPGFFIFETRASHRMFCR